MPKFKQRLTETLTHRTGQKVDCFYDPNDKLFKATLYGLNVVCASHEALVRTLWERMDKATVRPLWQDVIEIEETKPFVANEDHFFGFDYSRYHIWQRLDGKYMTARWNQEQTDEERLQYAEESWDICGKLTFPHQWRGRDTYKTLIYYTEEVWLALGVMQDKLLDLKGRFRELISSEEGLARLESFGAAKLLAGGMSDVDRARMIRRDAEHRGCKGKVRVARYEDGWIADHDPKDTKYWNDRKDSPVDHYFVTTWDDDDRRYKFDYERGSKLKGVEVTWIEEPVGLPQLGSGLDD